MEFVNVLKSAKPYTEALDLMPSICKHTNKLLISLAAAFKKPLNPKDIDKFHGDIVKLKHKYARLHPELWIDSGGYSFITGRYKSKDVPELTEGYVYYLQNYSNEFDYIFSLDFPFNKLDKSYNADLSEIKKANLSTTKETVVIIEKDIKLIDKYYFISQFLKPGFYKIWREIYSDAGLGNLIKNRAIGGLVGSRVSKRNIPSPFIGMAYRCFVDFLNSTNYNETGQFRLHFLGVYLLQDRFTILLLEKLFKHYISDLHVVFTCDNSGYGIQAMKRYPTLPAYIPWGQGNYRYLTNFDEINISPDIQDPNETSLDDLRKIYDESNISAARLALDNSLDKRLRDLQKDIKKYIGEKSIDGSKKSSGEWAIFEAFNLLSNKSMDGIMAKSIDRSLLVENISKAKNEIEIKEVANDFIFNISHSLENETGIASDLDTLAEATLFSDIYLLWSIRRSILEVFKYHIWFVAHRDDEKQLDRMLTKFVEDYNDPKVKW